MPGNAATIGRCIWIFAVLGPVFGYATVITLAGMQSAESIFDVLMIPLAAVMTAPFGIPAALFVGLLPSVLVGIVYWALRAKAAAGVMEAVALSVAAAVVVCAGVTALPDGDLAGFLSVEAWQLVVVPGIVATVLCAAYIERGLKKTSDGRRDYE